MNSEAALTSQTRKNLSQILTSSLASHIVSLGGVSDIPSESWPEVHTLKDSRLIVLTLSAYRFQGLMCLLAVADHATVELDNDQLKELANNLCGTFKRQLGLHVPVLGMSTPNLLQLECLPYLEDYRHETFAVHCVDSRGVSFYVSLLIQGDLDLRLSEVNAEIETTGELELF